MLIRRPGDIPSSEITDRKVYLNRRAFMRQAAGTAAAVATGVIGTEIVEAQRPAVHGRKLDNLKPSPFSTTEKLNTWDHITTYNNFLEFGSDKADASIEASRMKITPWTVSVEGECAKPGVMNLEDILKGKTLEERIYRLRCVEAWSMVIPWIGFPLSDLLKQVQPTS